MFEIGQAVIVGYVLDKHYIPATTESSPKHEWKPRKIIPRTGWVTGYRYKKNGRLERYHDEPTDFIPLKQIPCIMVTFSIWYNSIPVPISSSAIRIVDKEVSDGSL